MANVEGSKKRHKRRNSTVEEDDMNSPAEQQPSPSKRLRSGKKEQKADIKLLSPTKERKPKSSKDQTSNPKEPKDKSLSKGKDSKAKQVRTPSPIRQPVSSPLTTPKTPRGAEKLGIPFDAAKTMLKYASRLNPLVGMIYAATQYFTESKEDMPSREDFLPKLVDCVNSLVSTFVLSFFITYD
jgi:hypothetical protein